MSALELAMPLLIVLGGLVPLWSRQQQRRRLQRRLASAAEAVPGHRLRAPRRDEAIVIAAFAGGGVFGAWLALPWWVVPALAVFAAWGARRLCQAQQRRAARELFARDFPDAVEALLRAIQAGVPVDRALASLSELYSGELGQRFAHFARQLELGVPFRDALHELASGLDLPDVDFFCAALSLNRDSGGLLSTTLPSLSCALRERRATQRRLSALTAESRSAARIVAAMPLIVLLVQALTNPQQLQFLWQDDTGRVVGMYASASIVLGLFIIRRMSRF